MKLQLSIATMLILCGLLLLFMGFAADPIGEIDNSILIAFGETGTFAGALLGVDYRYKIKEKNR